ncbi:NUDIX domain-containing protein [Candidatus Gracilibacteria bacterium]|nr:NUDIX domain-containing protein [Candidatus Gracilibacteria bacterium]
MNILLSFKLRLLDLVGKLRKVSAIIVEKDEKVLIVKKPRENHAWQFPQGGREKDESVLEAAQREIKEECGAGLEIEFNSVPKGEYLYLFPTNFKRHKPGIRGARVVFLTAQFKSGEVKINKEELDDFKWVEKEELPQYFEGEYLEAVSRFV